MDCTGCAGGAVVARDLTGSLLLPLLLAACVGDAATVPRAPGIVLEHIATSAALPLSAWESLAVLRDDRACVLDSYEVRIVCGDREWRAQVALGRKGRGPGEIQMPGPLLSMPDGGLAYADLSNDRITLYTPDLQFARHSRMRDQGVVVAPITKDSLLLIAESGVRGPMRRIHSHDLAADSVIASMPLAIDSKRLGMDSIMASPVQRMADRMILRGTDDRLIWMSTDAQSILGQIPPPTFDPGYPDSIDIEEARADLKALFGVVFERDVERIRSRRKFHYARDDFAQFDESGRLWLLTNRPTSRSENADRSLSRHGVHRRPVSARPRGRIPAARFTAGDDDSRCRARYHRHQAAQAQLVSHPHRRYQRPK